MCYTKYLIIFLFFSFPVLAQTQSETEKFIIDKFQKYKISEQTTNSAKYKVYFEGKNFVMRKKKKDASHEQYEFYVFPLKYFQKFRFKSKQAGDCLCVWSEDNKVKQELRNVRSSDFQVTSSDTASVRGFYIPLNTELELEPDLEDVINQAFDRLKTLYSDQDTPAPPSSKPSPLCHTEDELISAYGADNITKNNIGSIKIISYEDDNVVWDYYISGETGKCNLAMLYPKKQSLISLFTNYSYNKSLQVIEKNKIWKYYDTQCPTVVTLDYDPKYGSKFTHTLTK